MRSIGPGGSVTALAAPSDDPTRPEAVAAPLFRDDLSAWVLTRYADVAVALRSPGLWPIPPLKKKNAKAPDLPALQRLREQMSEVFAPARLREWQAELARIAGELPRHGAVDLVHDYVGPLCLQAAELITGAAPQDRARLCEAARVVSLAAAEPLDEELRSRATIADADLADYFRDSAVPMTGPLYVALSRTLAALLLNGWLALLRQPGEFQRLRNDTDLIPGAVEELLRCAAAPRMLFRVSASAQSLFGLELAEGDRIALNLAAADRDDSAFPDPYRFDSARRGSHLALGAGLHMCGGGSLVRMMLTGATESFVRGFRYPQVSGNVEWQFGSGFCQPSKLVVLDRE